MGICVDTITSNNLQTGRIAMLPLNSPGSRWGRDSVWDIQIVDGGACYCMPGSDEHHRRSQ